MLQNVLLQPEQELGNGPGDPPVHVLLVLEAVPRGLYLRARHRDRVEVVRCLHQEDLEAVTGA